jgi:poly(hydroxyalkanoate) depolymerase family esterase
MPKRRTLSIWNSAFTRIFHNMARTASRAGSKAIAKTLKNASTAVKPKTAKATGGAVRAGWTSGSALGATGVRRYRLYKPPGTRRTERLPLMVMLHGCGQNAETFAQCTRMNRLAANKRFIVLYPEQERMSNAQNCWNWFDTRSGRAQREADSIDAAINHACLLQPIDRDRIVLAGLSAGAGMAALLAVRNPARYRAVAMHSGVPPGLAHSSATAVLAMRGRKLAGAPLPIGTLLPALLVIHGGNDPVVASGNALLAARLWAAQKSAKPCAARTVRRGARYPMTITDYRVRGRLAVTLCEVDGLGHAWSGGASGQAYSDLRKSSLTLRQESARK